MIHRAVAVAAVVATTSAYAQNWTAPPLSTGTSKGQGHFPSRSQRHGLFKPAERALRLSFAHGGRVLLHRRKTFSVTYFTKPAGRNSFAILLRSKGRQILGM
jgi:hypothetical protein